MPSDFRSCKMAFPGRLRIINLSSIAAQTGGITAPPYVASKAGLWSLTHSYARLLVKEGITVNAVAPALIETDMITEDLKATPAQIPVGRFGTVEESRMNGHRSSDWALLRYCRYLMVRIMRSPSEVSDSLGLIRTGQKKGEPISAQCLFSATPKDSPFGDVLLRAVTSTWPARAERLSDIQNHNNKRGCPILFAPL